ncbi:hypothetical protein CBS9595_002673 [Malassezia furfur]|nr:hypothetical protein CBS9595_002673 [Malassezia furfur]
MRIAVEGCSHGELDTIYDQILTKEKETSQRVDLLLLCGDVQAARNDADLHSLAVPVKYRRLGDFHRYYAGERMAPILTIVIGGNHEASNYLWELYFGGWLAPNIYYLGAAGCVRIGDLVIAGASGIYKVNDYAKGHYERQPYSPGDLRSIYHTRQFEISKLRFLHRPDIFLSHDWPNTIEQYGEVHDLIRRKPFFRQEIQTSSLGSPPLQSLLMTLHPRYWFSAHLHVRYAAKVLFNGPLPTKVPTESYLPPVAQQAVADEPNPEALVIDDDFDDAAPNDVRQKDLSSTAAEADVTEFLALSKCSSRLDYLEFIDVTTSHDTELAAIPANERPKLPLEFDSRWLAITKVLQPYFSLQRYQKRLPDFQDSSVREQINQEQQTFDKLAQEDMHALSIWRVQQFARTAPTQTEQGDARLPSSVFSNPQTQAFCALVQIPNPINSHFHDASTSGERHRGTTGVRVPEHPAEVPDADACQDELARIQAIAQDRKRKRYAADPAHHASS